MFWFCFTGYYCPIASSRPTQIMCGSITYYCPEGSPEPIRVSDGYYTIGGTPTTRSSQAICPPGSYCIDGYRIPCPPGTFGASEGLTSPVCSGECEPGFYCPLGSISSQAVGGILLQLYKDGWLIPPPLRLLPPSPSPSPQPLPLSPPIAALPRLHLLLPRACSLRWSAVAPTCFVQGVAVNQYQFFRASTPWVGGPPPSPPFP